MLKDNISPVDKCGGMGQAPENYVVLDIENPNARGNSICALGLLVVNNGIVVDKRYTLINPEDRFDRTNMEITGLSESMVLDAPALPEYWASINSLLTTNPILGHNIKYDLSVLSKSLIRYDIPVPEFRYICTLQLSRECIISESYSLANLLLNIGITYESHNALRDAEAAHQLYSHITHDKKYNDISINTYRHEYSLKEDLDSKLESNINDLYGIIDGVNYDGIVDVKEVAYLRKWVDDNWQYRDYALFNKIIASLSMILDDGVVTEYERFELLALVNSIKHSKIYSDSTLGIQILEGILKGIVCNQEITDTEIINLKLWLNDNNYLKGVYPYDKIVNAIEKILSDEVVTEEEKEYLACEIDEILNPISSSNDLDFNGKTFCLTGDFKCGAKSDVEGKIISKGGIRKSGVSGKLDYLFVGGLGSEAWKYGNIGGKIAKAQELQEKGKNIQIVGEDDLVPYL